MQLLYVPFEGPDGAGASVILNGSTIYHEDDDADYSNPNFPARDLAKRLAKALNVKAQTVRLGRRALGKEWNFDDVETLALKKAAKANSKSS